MKHVDVPASHSHALAKPRYTNEFPIGAFCSTVEPSGRRQQPIGSAPVAMANDGAVRGFVRTGKHGPRWAAVAYGCCRGGMRAGVLWRIGWRGTWHALMELAMGTRCLQLIQAITTRILAEACPISWADGLESEGRQIDAANLEALHAMRFRGKRRRLRRVASGRQSTSPVKASGMPRLRPCVSAGGSADADVVCRRWSAADLLIWRAISRLPVCAHSFRMLAACN